MTGDFETEKQQANGFEFAYLQLHTHFSPFGGLATAPELAQKLAELAGEGRSLAAALTDTFSLAATSQWQMLLDEAEITPLIGAELGVSWGNGTNRTLPAALVLLPENQTGYQNLCRLLSRGLTQAATAPLTAFVDPDTLSAHREGLIAISPYYGGPVTAGLKLKAAEGRSRAQTLRDIFGPANFFLGAPPPAGQPEPNTAEERPDSRLAGVIKLNAALVKLARDLKIELIATGEARYLSEEDTATYSALRNRLSRPVAEQYAPAQLLQPQDWLYAIRADRPTTGLHLHSPDELIAHYNDKDWPGALASNRVVALRCSSWKMEAPDPLTELRQRCETELERRYANPDGALPEEQQSRAWLESELADIEELGLAGGLLAAAQAVTAAAEVRQIAVARRVSGSLVAYLLGLSSRPPEITEGDTFHFAFEEGSRPLRLEVGRQGRSRLLAALNMATIMDEQEWKAAPVVRPASEPGSPALLHPRQIALSTTGAALGQLTPLQPAVETGDGTKLHLGAQSGPILPPGLYKLEVIEATGLARLQFALDILNEWRLREGLEPLRPDDLPQPVEGSYEEPGLFERALVRTRLEWFRQEWPAAYYAAALTLAEPGQQAGIAEAVRQANLKLLPPAVELSKPHFTMQDETALRVGLASVLGWDKAEEFSTKPAPDSLAAVVQICPLSQKEWEKLAWSGALDKFGAREVLAESAAQLAEISQEWHTQEESRVRQAEEQASQQSSRNGGQLSLFDMFETVEETPETTELKPIALPEVKSLSRLQRLRQEFATLGFYTSEHPLWQQPAVEKPENSRSTILTLDVAGQSEGKEGQPLTLAGMIVGLRRLPFTEQDGRGQELTILRLEDWTGRLELLVPPALTANFELEEGSALTALARWLKGANSPRPVLVAEKLDQYPPAADFTSDEEAADLAALDDVPLDGNIASAEPPQDESWAASLFAGYGATPEKPASTGEQNQSQEASRGRNGGKSNGTKEKRARTVRHVHIKVNLPGDETEDDEVFNRLKEVLRQHKGEDIVHLYLSWPDGESSHLEPQSMTVTYSPEFAAAVKQVLGDAPDTVTVEERMI